MTAPGLVGGLMVCGTTSDAGKTTVVTALCRLLARRGVRVAPFKAQNMALNSYVTPSGHEIGRAQGVQALAAGVTPEVAMNPILLKPTGERTSQVVVLGRPWATLDAMAYHQAKPGLLDVVLGALADLRARFDVVVCEGAGSPTEINLLAADIVNLRVAKEAGLPAIVVGDIDRGGVFAALYGTVALLPDELRTLVRGFVINKFRGDPALLGDGTDELARRCGVPTLGVLPWLPGLGLDAEDSLALRGPASSPEWTKGSAALSGAGPGDTIDVVGIRLPRISNFTDFDALAVEPGVHLRLVDRPGELGRPDLVILPGTKTTVEDLAWFRRVGLADALGALAAEPAARTTILGICGGYQMLGQTIVDTVESASSEPVPALGILPVRTTFAPGKITRQRRGTALGQTVTGYEIRHGTTASADPWVALTPVDPTVERDVDWSEPEGSSAAGGRVLGTSLHGLLESDGFRSAFLAAVAERAGKRWRPSGVSFAAARETRFDRLADLVEAHLDVDALDALIGEGVPVAGRRGTTGRSQSS